MTDQVKDEAAPLSLWGEAWKNLRKQPLFLISAFLILVVVAVSFFPGLFSPIDPTSEACQLANSNAGPAAATRSASPSRAATSTRASSTARGPR